MEFLLLLIVLLFFGAGVALFVLIIRGARLLFGPRRRLEAELGLDALKARLARGELTTQEFEQARRALGV